MSVFDRQRLTDTAKARYLRKLGAGIIAVSLALGGLFVAYGADCKPGDTGCNTGGGGSTGGNQGSGNFTSQVVWATDDNFGPANDGTVLDVLTRRLGGKAYNNTNTNIHTATTNALNECINNYAARHNGDRNAGCRVFGVGAVKSNDNTIANATGGHNQAAWLRAWSAEVNNRTYYHNGVPYNTNIPLNNGANTINGLAERETAGGERSLVVIVMAQDQPNIETPPPAPSKVIEQGISADHMRNLTRISTETGIGGKALWMKDTFNPHGMRYTISDQSVWNTSTGQNISGCFDYNTANGTTPPNNEAFISWHCGTLPDKQTFEWRFNVTVDHPTISQVDNGGTVKWNDKPDQYTGWKTFPTWWGTPNKAWVVWNESENRWMSISDRDWTNSVGADNMAILNGSKIGSAVNSLISRDLINIPMGYQIADDHQNAEARVLSCSTYPQV